MGLLGKLFGGGTELSVALNSTNVIAGGTVAGKVTVTGGKKALNLDALVVKVVYVHVQTVTDSPLPKIDLRQLAQATVVANQPLAPGKAHTWDFAIGLPDGLDAGGSYKLLASADIPSVKDPSAEAEFKVITPGAHRRGGLLGAVLGASEDELLGRYPGLLSDDEDEQFTALCELRGDAYGDDAKQLVGLAPWLLRFVKTGPVELRDEALETWATLLNNRARPSDIVELEALAREPGLSDDLRQALVTAAVKFADEGAAPLLQQFARDPSPELREQVARSLAYDADEGLAGRLDLILGLTADADVTVRRAAASALGSFSDDRRAMDRAVALAASDPSPDVKAEALESLGGAHWNGMLELVVTTYQAHLASPSSEVRKAIAGRLASLPADPRVGPMVQALLADRSSEVRKRMAWYGVNMSDHPDLAPLFRATAERDADDDVRAEAVYGMRGFLGPADACAYARARLAADPTERMAWSVYQVARSHDDDPAGKALLKDLAKSQFADVAGAARD